MAGCHWFNANCLLEQLPWEEVKKEMTDEKGLQPDVADKIGEYVKLKGALKRIGRVRSWIDSQANPCYSSNFKQMKN
jgi:histidyl-tRNA synthetase